MGAALAFAFVSNGRNTVEYPKRRARARDTGGERESESGMRTEDMGRKKKGRREKHHHHLSIECSTVSLGPQHPCYRLEGVEIMAIFESLCHSKEAPLII